MAVVAMGECSEIGAPAEETDLGALCSLVVKVNDLAAELGRVAIADPATHAVGGSAGERSRGPSSLVNCDTDAVRVDQLRALELLKSAASAVQARVSAVFAASQESRQRDAGVPRSRRGRGIPSQVALARRESSTKAGTLVGLAVVLTTEMPYTLKALARGEINEWRATIIVRETAVLSREDRAAVDRELCGPGGAAPDLSDSGIEKAARAIGQRLDPGMARARAKKAERERRVTIRPAPDCMASITVTLPVAEGVGVYAALKDHADRVFAAGQNVGPDGEALNRGEVMTDEFVRRMLNTESGAPTEPAATSQPARRADAARPADAERRGRVERPDNDEQTDGATHVGGAATVGGPYLADRPAASGSGASFFRRPASRPQPAPVAVPVPQPGVEIQLIMTDRTLFGLDDEPAHLTGYGPIPAALARQLASGSGRIQDHGTDSGTDNGTDDGTDPSADDDTGAGRALRWIRRLYRRPDTGELISMDSRRRIFPAGLRRFIVARDQFCRTPWCGAPIRHIDHVDPAGAGGPTCAANAQGLCAACNYAKQAAGWRQTSTGIDGEVVTTTPTGHQYSSRPPKPPGGSPDLDLRAGSTTGQSRFSRPWATA